MSMDSKYDILAKDEYIEIIDKNEPEAAHSRFVQLGINISYEDVKALKKSISEMRSEASSAELSESDLEETAGGCYWGYRLYKAVYSYINNSRRYNGGGGGAW